MSYCRWSSDNYQCDLYCYEDVNGGWTTHVASMRYIDGKVPTPDLSTLSPENMEQWHKEHLEPIGLPHDGKTFNDPTLEAFLSRLLSLRAQGYRFPDDVLIDVDAEIAQRDASPSNHRSYE